MKSTYHATATDHLHHSSPTRRSNAVSGRAEAIVGSTGFLRSQQPLSSSGGRDGGGGGMVSLVSSGNNLQHPRAHHYPQHPAKVSFCPFSPSLYGCINSIHAPLTLERKKELPCSNDSWSGGKVSDNVVYNEHEADALLLSSTKHPSTASLDGLTNAYHQRVQTNDGNLDVYPASTSMTSKSSRSLLLELRCLHAWTDEPSRRNGKRFTSRVVGVSRGIAGSSAISTCLTFRPISENVTVTAAPGATYPLSQGSGEYKVQVATGLTSGSLCVHTGTIDTSNLDFSSFHNSRTKEASLPDPTPFSVSYYTTRYAKHATCAAWRPTETRFVAVGLQSQRGKSKGEEFCCFVWDVEHQSSAGGPNTGGANTATSTGNDKRDSLIKSPSSRLARNVGVSSVAWLDNGALLAVGTAVRNLHLYDLRIRGSNSPPVSAAAHSDAVSGIIPDPIRSNVFATFSEFSDNDPVKLWDIRKMHRALVEIKTGQGVNDVQYSTYSPGILCVSAGDIIRFYDIAGTFAGQQNLLTRPVLIRSIHNGADDTNNGLLCMAFPPIPSEPSKRPNETDLYPRRLLAASKSGLVHNIPTDNIAPLAISSRDGNIAHSSGGHTLWMSTMSVSETNSNSSHKLPSRVDISGIIMQRADCSHATSRYSTDAAENVRMLSQEGDETEAEDGSSQTRQQLLRTWKWILKIESLCDEQREESSSSTASVDDLPWPAKSLIDGGVYRLLRMNPSEERTEPVDHGAKGKSDKEGQQFFNTLLEDMVVIDNWLGCRTYDSPVRRLALTACGWASRSRINNVLEDLDACGQFERSALIAVLYGELGSAVASLQNGASWLEVLDNTEKASATYSSFVSSYKESLQLAAMCIAGYSGHASQQKENVWQNACDRLMERPELNPSNGVYQRPHIPYLRAACMFLRHIGREEGEAFASILEDEKLYLCDRVGFACLFLSRNELRSFLESCMNQCLTTGNLEGIQITGLDKIGFAILGAQVDRFSDVQTAALISSRVIIPPSWTTEQNMSSEWLESYRELLNTFQMWKSRALFDIGRAEKLRRLKVASAEGFLASANLKTQSLSTKQNSKLNSRTGFGALPLTSGPEDAGLHSEEILKLPYLPPQLYARCNYCSTSLPLHKLRRQKGMANNWLSRQKPVLSCCPSCRKPLPRCAICLLPLGCLNPYLELKRERGDRLAMAASSSVARVSSSSDDLCLMDETLSGLATLPFAEWFSWCMRCKHGGHSHHLIDWFDKHVTCPVSGCNCRCQFDRIPKLKRFD